MGELEEATLDESLFGMCTNDETQSQSSNELVSFASSELMRGPRSAWRRARISSCEEVGYCTPKRCSAETTWTATMKSSETSVELCEGGAEAMDSS